nr:unnamed protein product [Callosobruchus analis]
MPLRSVHADPHLTLGGHYIAVQPTAKLLGVVFDCKLNWKDHIDHLVIRCRKVINLIKYKKVLKVYYHSNFESRLRFGILYFGNCSDFEGIFGSSWVTS